MSRTIQKIQCKLCGNHYSSVGLFTHLRDTHQMTTEEYVSTYGEFRVNKLKKIKVDTDPCLICNDGVLYNSSGLTWHLKQRHGITKVDYVTQCILGGNIPTCACGCGQELPIKYYKPYVISKFISGHNSKGKNNPRYGKSFSVSTIEKMRLRALDRIEQYRKDGQIPMHTDDAIAKRGKAQTDRYIQKVQNTYNITVLDRHILNDVTQYTIECNVCHTIHTRYYNADLVCPTCNPRVRSKLEEELIVEIRKIHPTIDIQHNNRRVLQNNRELDIVIPDAKLAIEINGLYWHSELNGKNKNYHLQKTKEVEQHGYQLLHIFEDEWYEYRDVILHKVANLLGKASDRKIFARKCDIREVSAKDTRQFLELYHLQGSDSAKHRYGLYHNDELVMMMTFSKPNASRGRMKSPQSATYELSRMCTKVGVRCVGGASKLLKHFITQHAPQHIISYADRRYSISHNNVYEQLGFTLTKTTLPNYWYFSYKEMKRHHRFNFTKRKTVALGGVSDKTEWENMVSLGYDRIWDCGHLRYEMVL
jgi:very-short-patch-repair endonuclease